MVLTRLMVGGGCVALNLAAIRLQDDVTRQAIGWIAPVVSFVIWQVLIVVTVRRAQRHAQVDTIDTIVHGEQTLDLLLSALDQRAVRRDMQ